MEENPPALAFVQVERADPSAEESATEEATEGATEEATEDSTSTKRWEVSDCTMPNTISNEKS